VLATELLVSNGVSFSVFTAVWFAVMLGLGLSGWLGFANQTAVNFLALWALRLTFLGDALLWLHHGMCVYLLVLRFVIAAVGIDVVSLHILPIVKSAVSRLRVAIAISMKSGLSEISRVSTVRKQATIQFELLNLFFNVGEFFFGETLIARCKLASQ